ncbi:MAG TPA: DUF2157 domain-containing protein [Actinomycetota bacterium]
MSTVHEPDLHDEELERHLRLWVSEALISSDEAESIRAFETRRAPAAPRIPLVAEALGYLGAALTLAAGIVVFARVWDDLSPGGRVTVLASATLLAFAGGLVLRGSEESAFGRLSSVLWLLAVGGTAWSVGLLAADVLDVSDRLVPVWVGGAMTVSAALLYALHPRTLQLFGLTAGLLTLLTGWWQSPIPIGLSWWVVGAAYMTLGWRGALRPRQAALRLGAIVAVIGPCFMVADVAAGTYILGLATAGAILAVSVAIGEPLLLVPGALALFGYLLSAIQRYLGDTLGMPIVLLLAGVALLAIALVTARLRALTRERGGTLEP